MSGVKSGAVATFNVAASEIDHAGIMTCRGGPAQVIAGIAPAHSRMPAGMQGMYGIVTPMPANVTEPYNSGIPPDCYNCYECYEP